jgi:hypothetical protein
LNEENVSAYSHYDQPDQEKRLERLFLKAKQRANTFYGVSNERILIASGLTKKTVASHNLRTLNNLSLIQNSDGSGRITFGPSSLVGPWFGQLPWPGLEFFTGTHFDFVEDAKAVYQRIRNAQNALTTRTP